MPRFTSADLNRCVDSRPKRIDTSIHVGRRESMRRFTSVDLHVVLINKVSKRSKSFFIYIFTGASQNAHEAPLVPGVITYASIFMYAYLPFATPHQPSRGEYLREGQWEDLGTSRPKHLAWCSWAAVLFSRVWWGGSGDHAADRYRRRPAHLTGACCDSPAKLPALAALTQ